MLSRQDDNTVCGIEVIDQQHQEIVRLVGKFNETRTQIDAADCLDELALYTAGHFKYEELLIEASDYRFCDEHRRQHKLFFRRLTEYQENLCAGKVKVAVIRNFLRSWFIQHMSYDDSLYAKTTRHKIKEILKDQSANGWHRRMLAQCFPQGELCVQSQP